jgi:hypothetical protein
MIPPNISRNLCIKCIKCIRYIKYALYGVINTQISVYFHCNEIIDKRLLSFKEEFSFCVREENCREMC